MADKVELDAESLGMPLDARWQIECSIERVEEFVEPLYEYRCHQGQGAGIVDRLNQQLDGIILRVGSVDKSMMYSGDRPCDTFLDAVTGAPLSEQQEQLLADVMACLEQAGWAAHAVPYGQGSLKEHVARRMARCIGLLSSETELLEASFSAVPGVRGDEQLIVLAGDVDGYPIVPELFGDFSDSDVPCYAQLLLGEDRILHLDVGCGYVIEQSTLLSGTPIVMDEAVQTALRHAYQEWQTAWSAMAMEKNKAIDYPAFWAAYDPQFILRVTGAQACYYAMNGKLRPCWRVDCQVAVQLSNDEQLTAQERHRYTYETLNISYYVDAMSGEGTWQ